MRKLALAAIAAVLCLGPATAFSQTTCVTAVCFRGAPAPLIGAGLPALAAVGGLFVGFRLWRRRQSKKTPD